MDWDEPVELEEYDPDWTDWYEREGIRLLDELEDSTRDVAHIGSTAVEGMVARPIVDIQIGVDSLEAVSQHVVALQQLGYDYFGDAGVDGRLYFRRRGELDCDLTVVLHRGEIWRRDLAVVDYLSEHDDRADAYSDLKRQLVDDRGLDRLEDYLEARRSFLDDLAGDALAWAEEA